QQANVGELSEQLAREPVLPVPVGRVGRDLGFREVSRQRLYLPLVGRKLEHHRAANYKAIACDADQRGRAGLGGAAVEHTVSDAGQGPLLTDWPIVVAGLASRTALRVLAPFAAVALVTGCGSGSP